MDKKIVNIPHNNHEEERGKGRSGSGRLIIDLWTGFEDSQGKSSRGNGRGAGRLFNFDLDISFQNIQGKSERGAEGGRIDTSSIL